MKWLGGVLASPSTRAVGEVVASPFFKLAPSHHQFLRRLKVDEPVKLFASVAAKLATEGKATSSSEPTPADEVTLGVGSFCVGISSTAKPNPGSRF